MSLPWEQPAFNAGMVEDLATARLALTWALGRIHELEAIKARLEAAEASLMRSRRESVPKEEVEALRSAHAAALDEERAVRAALETRLAEAVRHEAPVVDVAAAEEAERLRAEIDRLKHELELSWIAAEQHRDELEKLRDGKAT